MPIDYKRYPPNWKSEIRPRILARANNACEVEGCGLKHGQLVYQGKNKRIEWYQTFEEAKEAHGILAFEKPVKVVITIAHLDHDETNHDVKDDRLMAMCQLHHLRYDAKEKYRRVMNLTATK